MEDLSKDDIKIAGYSLADLRKQRAAIQKEANKFISDAISGATEVAKKIAECEDSDKIAEMAMKAKKLLENVETVAQASGVEYYLPNRGDNCYDSRDEVITCILNDVSTEVDIDELQELIEQAEEMECQTSYWNASSC